MASTGISRKVDDLGRVVIPVGVRRTLGITEGDLLEVHLEDERVVLQRPDHACVFCGDQSEDLHVFEARRVCSECVARLVRETPIVIPEAQPTGTDAVQRARPRAPDPAIARRLQLAPTQPSAAVADRASTTA